MKKDLAIQFQNVTKEYKLFKHEGRRLAHYLFQQKGHHKTVRANNDISFTVQKGESVAIIGDNGAGKSTLLKIITGVVFPTHGEATVNGRVSAILELSAGFDNSFTGRENIHLKGLLLGLDKSEIQKVEKSIVKFADLGDYIDQPVKTYSSGMRARLGFAINSHIDPDILIIDEALSVGDKDFKKKCKAKITEIRNREHVTVLIVTHSPDQAVEFCERGIVLSKGKLVFDGPIKEAVKFYGA